MRAGIASMLAAVTAGTVIAGEDPSAAAVTGTAGTVSAEAPAPTLRAEVVRPVALRSRPRGSLLATLSPRTEFGATRVLAVVRRRGRWLGVLSPHLPNGQVGWIRASRAVRLSRISYELRADLSRRRLELRRDGRVLLRARVTVGAPGSPTPTGRFAVTDKLSGNRFSGYFGCCILALSGRQPRLPAGWPGGDRLAIHGTDDPGAVGRAASAGCLRAREGDMRRLMRAVPLGTPVIVQR